MFCCNLLETAGLFTTVKAASPSGVPLGVKEVMCMHGEGH